MKKIKFFLTILIISNLLSGCFDSYDENGFKIKNGIHKDTKTFYDNNGYNKDGFNKNGFNKSGYDKNGYDKNGFNNDGYDKNGFNKDGYDKNGFNKNGFDINAFDKEGINYITKTNFDINGFDKSGFNKNGFDIKGIHKDTKTKYDLNGFDKNGFDIKGIHKDTKTNLDINGFDKDGYIKDSGKYINVGAIICSNKNALSELLNNIENNNYWTIWEKYLNRGICMESKYKVRSTKENPFVDLNDGITKVRDIFIATQEIRRDKFSGSEIKKDNIKGVVIINDLMWQDAMVNDNNQATWYQGKEYCENANYSGYSDWTLPTAFQLKELYENRAKLSFIADGGYWGHTYEIDTKDAWNINMDNGQFKSRYKDMRAFVRCVRNNK